ncbi:MAG: hypothetical protein ABIQ12_00575 [Opitutaceae bacterium]
MKKSSKSFIALIVLSLATAGFGFAAGDPAPAPKAGACCTKAAADGKTCAHPCCVEAAKAGNNCTKCGGAGKIVKKA